MKIDWHVAELLFFLFLIILMYVERYFASNYLPFLYSISIPVRKIRVPRRDKTFWMKVVDDDSDLNGQVSDNGSSVFVQHSYQPFVGLWISKEPAVISLKFTPAVALFWGVGLPVLIYHPKQSLEVIFQNLFWLLVLVVIVSVYFYRKFNRALSKEMDRHT